MSHYSSISIVIPTSNGKYSNRVTYSHKCIMCEESFPSSEQVQQHLVQEHMNKQGQGQDDCVDVKEEYLNDGDTLEIEAVDEDEPSEDLDEEGSGGDEDIPLLPLKPPPLSPPQKEKKTLMSFKKKKDPWNMSEGSGLGRQPQLQQPSTSQGSTGDGAIETLKPGGEKPKPSSCLDIVVTPEINLEMMDYDDEPPLSNIGKVSSEVCFFYCF